MITEIHRKSEQSGGWMVKAKTDSQDVAIKRDYVPLNIEEAYNALLHATNEYLFNGESYVTNAKFIFKDNRSKFSAVFPCQVNSIDCEMKIKELHISGERSLKEDLDALLIAEKSMTLYEGTQKIQSFQALLNLRIAIEVLNEKVADNWDELCLPEEDRMQLNIDFFKPIPKQA